LKDKLQQNQNANIDKDAMKDRVDAASEEIKSLKSKLNVSVKTHNNDEA
jgi:hypothetical protein